VPTSPDDVIERRIQERMRDSAKELTDIQYAQRLYTISKLALRGVSSTGIAAHPDVNLPDSTVRDMLRKIKAEWKLLYGEASADLRVAELAKLDHIETEAWEAWERSKENKRRDQINSEINVKSDGTSKRTPRVARTIQEDRTGDPRYLDVIFRCIDKRDRLLGLSKEGVGGILSGVQGELTALDIRVERYRGVLNNGFIEAPRAIIDHDNSGEPVDSE